MPSSFLDFYLSAFLHPQRTFNQLVTDPRRVKFGVLFVTIPALLYIFVYIFLNHGGGAPSVFTPWLNIPKEVYYFYNRFLTAPSFYMSWILAAGVVQLLSRAFNGKGTFEDTLAVMGLGIAVAMWGTMLHDLVMSFLGAIRVISLSQHEIDMNSPTIWRTVIWTCMIIYLVWFIMMFSKGIEAAQKVKRKYAVLLGIIGFVVFQLVFLIFNR